MLKVPAKTIDLETERTTMRPHTLSDFDDCAAMWADPAVTLHISGQPSTRQESWARHLRNIGHWSALGFGYWVVREKSTGNFWGEVGFGDFQRAIEPPLDAVPEMGWVLCTAVHGKGVASETARAACAWGDQYFSADKTVCIIAPEHAGSISVALKQGFEHKHITSYRGEQTLIMERQKPI
ncbi:MAG: GNAT family N-acetyltransferase [Alphaproteobacteria bacterium]|nr:GNAT family N-acetyltransferase [Alphaproteobacteria bacterium]